MILSTFESFRLLRDSSDFWVSISACVECNNFALFRLANLSQNNMSAALFYQLLMCASIIAICVRVAEVGQHRQHCLNIRSHINMLCHIDVHILLSIRYGDHESVRYVFRVLVVHAAGGPAKTVHAANRAISAAIPLERLRIGRLFVESVPIGTCHLVVMRQPKISLPRTMSITEGYL